MVSRTSIPYAPYIMRLIKMTLKNDDFSDNLLIHKMKRPYVKNVEDNPRPATRGSFMADARASGDAPARKPRASSTLREVRKLSWVEKNILCMKVDIHREQYHAHCERLDIAHTQGLQVSEAHEGGGEGGGQEDALKGCC